MDFHCKNAQKGIVPLSPFSPHVKPFVTLFFRSQSWNLSLSSNGKTGNYNSATILKLTPQSSNEILISLLDEYRNDYFEITIVATEAVMQII